MEKITVKVEESWIKILWNLDRSQSKEMVYVFGVPDSGKSSFCRFLFENLSGHPRAYIDCDPGQSVIGPPTTIGLKVVSESGKAGEILHFVGSTSPSGHLLQTLVGIKKLSEKAESLGAQIIILDSSGFVLGPTAQEFQFQVLDIIQPGHICALQNSAELEMVLKNFEQSPRIRIHRLPVSDAVVPRDMQRRQVYREQRFKEYFRTLEPHQLPLKNMGLHGMIPDFKNPLQCKNRLIALCDRENYVVTLGMVRWIHAEEGLLRFEAPPFDPKQVVSVQFGSIYLSSTGVEIKREVEG
ncbi:MAG: hypothetical protein Kow0042_05320 [Calditrichia bacterium]